MKNYAKTSTLFKAMQTWKSKIWLLAASLVFINSCTLDEDNMDDLDLKSQQISALVGKIGISDAANDGIDEFYFLAPTVKESPKFNGRFHGNLKPVVEISDDFEFKRFHQVFSREGTGGNKVVVNPSDETYSVTWNTADSKVVKGNMYRIRVRINNRILGFVDVGIVSPKTKELKHNVIPLAENQTMTIAFRIEDKICPARIEVLPAEATIPVGGEQQFEAIVYNFYDEVLEDQSIKWSVDDESLASISNTGLATGLAPGTVIISAQSQDVTGTASLIVVDPNTVTDIDGNVYRTVKIGNQIWMAEDLRVTKYNDGTEIVGNLSNLDWSNTFLGSYRNPVLPGHSGKFYNWFAANSLKLCPEGWRVAGWLDWLNLTQSLGATAGGQMKSKTGWLDDNVNVTIGGATNSTGFSVVGTGEYNEFGQFMGNASEARFWSASITPGSNPNLYPPQNFPQDWVHIFSYSESHVNRGFRNFRAAFCLRCIKQ
jgi:uncharacterized protein (TIGR02145 family)